MGTNSIINTTKNGELIFIDKLFDRILGYMERKYGERAGRKSEKTIIAGKNKTHVELDSGNGSIMNVVRKPILFRKPPIYEIKKTQKLNFTENTKNVSHRKNFTLNMSKVVYLVLLVRV